MQTRCRDLIIILARNLQAGNGDDDLTQIRIFFAPTLRNLLRNMSLQGHHWNQISLSQIPAV
jgi:hypothetical protein